MNQVGVVVQPFDHGFQSRVGKKKKKKKGDLEFFE